MLSCLCLYLGFSSDSTVFLLVSLVSKAFLLSSKVPQLYHNYPLHLSISAHGLQEGLRMAHAPASLKSTSQQTSPDKDHYSLYLILFFSSGTLRAC